MYVDFMSTPLSANWGQTSDRRGKDLGTKPQTVWMSGLRVPQITTGRVVWKQKFTSSWSWRLEVLEESAGRFGVSWGLPPGLIDGHVLPLSSRACPSTCLCPSLPLV